MRPVRVACLPVAGPENPYQFRLIQGLNENRNIEAFPGVNNKHIGILSTALKFKPNYIHFDWETSYYLRKRLFLSLINFPSFVLQVLICKYILRVKLVWTPHNVLPHDSRHIWFHNMARRFFASNMCWIRVFSANSIGRFIKQLKVDKSFFIVQPEGSFIDDYPFSIDKSKARKILSIDDKVHVYLYFGMIKPYKGIEELIKAFNQINNPKAQLYIVGKAYNSEYFKKLTDLAGTNNSIIFENRFIKNDEVQMYFGIADFVVFPFKRIENSGSVILAMGFKKAIIAPYAGVLPERLCKQPQLLYKDELAEKLAFAGNMSLKEIEKIGEENFMECQRYKWEDFSNYFTL